ncbi:MAG: HD domain-containing protein, partial [Deltaproteobacteria bacterium]
GGAYRYVSKPWKDEELLQIIRDAASRYRLIVENRRLIQIINQQNRELKSWNEKLEARVKEQTEELQRKNKELETLADRLQRTFESTIDAFAGLIELRNAFVRDHSRKVTQLALLLAEKAGMSGKDLETLRVGALLHDVGKIGIPDLMLQKDPEEYSPEEVEEYRKHPVRGQTAIDSVEELREAGIIIRGHHENYDGSGFPDGLKGSKIPLGARIVRLCDFVDNHFSRCQGKNALEQTAAKVKEGKFTLFDPDLVSAAVDLIPRVYAEFTPDTDMVEVEVSPDHLKPGMILARDVTSGTGLLLLRKGTPLDSTKIASLRRYYTLDPSRSGIFVFTKK